MAWADRILDYIKENSEGISKQEVFENFGWNNDSAVDVAIDRLINVELIEPFIAYGRIFYRIRK